MRKIDIAIIAVKRPEILDNTLSSFKKFLHLSDDSNIYINIDPVGLDIDSMDVVNVVLKYFNNVKYNCPETPSFTKALKWCWSNVQSDFFINLEDDWEMQRGINLLKVLRDFNDNKLVQIAFKWAHVKKSFKGNEMANFTGVPSICRTEFFKLASTLLDDKKNVEKQMKAINKLKYLKPLRGYKYKINLDSCIVDLGRPWNKKHDIKHNGLKEEFTCWIK